MNAGRPLTVIGAFPVGRPGASQGAPAQPGYGSRGMLALTSSFCDLLALWLADLERQDLVEGTKVRYRDNLRLDIMPAFEHFTLGEITTGRVEWFLKSEAVSCSRAKRSRTLLNLLFGFAVRYDAIPRNPVDGTSPLEKPKGSPQALMLEQIPAFRRRLRAGARARTSGHKARRPGQRHHRGTPGNHTAHRRGARPASVRHRGCAERDGHRGAWDGGVAHQARCCPAESSQDRAFGLSNRRTRVRRGRPPCPPGDGRFGRRGADDLCEPRRWPVQSYNVRRAFRAFLYLAGLEGRAIMLRWYRRTGATVIARGAGAAAGVGFFGHGSTAITESYYIEPDRTVDPDDALLRHEMTAEEEEALAEFDESNDDQTERHARKLKIPEQA